jgi:hypothetical protein
MFWSPEEKAGGDDRDGGKFVALWLRLVNGYWSGAATSSPLYLKTVAFWKYQHSFTSLHNEGVCPFDFPAQLTDIDFGEVVPHNSENIFYFY